MTLSLSKRAWPFALAFVFALATSCGGKQEEAIPAPTAAAQPVTNDAPAPATSEPAAGTCEACRARHCTDYQRSGVDLLAGCAGKPDLKLAPNPDAQFAQDCSAVLACAYKHKCGYDALRGPVQCYCGSASLEDCDASGPAADASCAAEWKAATRGSTNAEILARFSELAYPSGWAFSLLECDRTYCGPTSKWGVCTP